MNVIHVNIEDGYIIEQRTEWDEAEEKYIHIKKKVKKTLVYEDWKAPWIVEIDGDKIKCFCKKTSAHGVKEQRTSFDLEDGTLVFPGTGDRNVEFRPKDFCEWLAKNNLTQLDTTFLDHWRDDEDNVIIYGRNADCGAGTASHIIITDGKLVSQEKESANWVEDSVTGSWDDSYFKYTIANPTYIIEFSMTHYRSNHNYERILYTRRWDNKYEYILKMLPYEIKEKLENFSAIMPSCIYTEVKAPKKDYGKSSDGEATHLFG